MCAITSSLTPLLLILSITICVSGREGFGGGSQDWGFVTVRPEAHMFWWLYYTTADVVNYAERPLLIWLQGGPGMSSTGFGNFLEIGPLDQKLNKRHNATTENFNVLFIDSPVGSGFSYVDNSSKLVKTGVEITADLYICLQKFFQTHRDFRRVPVFMFGESYGGKMVVEFADYFLHKPQKKQFFNLTGLILGDAYISPIDYVNNFVPMMKSLGLGDRRYIKLIEEWTEQLRNLIREKRFKEATVLEDDILQVVYLATLRLNPNNFSWKIRPDLYGAAHFIEQNYSLHDLMNGDVKRKLNISSDWVFYNEDVHHSLSGDSIRSVTDKVETLLDKFNLKIIVYNGIFDIIVNTAGTLDWLARLNWRGKDKWEKERRFLFIVEGVGGGFVKKVENLSFFGVYNAGHIVPIDNFAAFDYILKQEIFGVSDLKDTGYWLEFQ